MQRENEPEAVYKKTNNKEIIMQRENKWQDRWQNHLVSACDWIEDDVIKNMTVAKILSRWAVIRDEIQSEIDTAIAEERKAFGGCTKCYGKGYATVRYGFNAHADFIGDKSYEYGTKTHMEFCSCDRGEQLKKLLNK